MKRRLLGAKHCVLPFAGIIQIRFRGSFSPAHRNFSDEQDP